MGRRCGAGQNLDTLDVQRVDELQGADPPRLRKSDPVYENEWLTGTNQAVVATEAVGGRRP